VILVDVFVKEDWYRTVLNGHVFRRRDEVTWRPGCQCQTFLSIDTLEPETARIVGQDKTLAGLYPHSGPGDWAVRVPDRPFNRGAGDAAAAQQDCEAEDRQDL
jgi:hypothetical protein